jgi:hypothetical protein
VYPIVRLSKTFMPTKYKGRMRPHFEIMGWLKFGSGGETLPVVETPKLSDGAVEVINPMAPAEASAKATLNKVAASGVQEVKEPSLSEEMGDKVPW